jgi:MerR family mercuric resistance operon transcriptional regulator
MSSLTIGEVATRVGIGVETVRYYERRGLIEEPPRRPSGYRAYSAEAVRRLRFIRRAKALGFSLREIGDLLELEAGGAGRCRDVRRQVASKLADLDARLADLQRMRRALAALAAACERSGRARCPVLDALEEGEAEGAGP